MEASVAVVYQAASPPARNGVIKPMKPGGYSDSGADIAYALQGNGISMVLPVKAPLIENDFDWVFPDTTEGIQQAIDKGADTIWLNTVLYTGHPVEAFIKKGIYVVGQIPANADRFDDKLVTNELLRDHELPIPKSVMINNGNDRYQLNFSFPVVAKPIRGRGSQGVTVVKNEPELLKTLADMFSSNDFGAAIYVEEFLSGEELTITVMPPGHYSINSHTVIKDSYWSLPPVKRFNHHNGIAPYNGTVAVVNNSVVLSPLELLNPAITVLCHACEKAASLVGAKAAIRIDCRADAKGKYFLFDLNMKPNMTGASRPHRGDQDSLTTMAARSIGWTFEELLLNMLQQRWR